MKALLLSLVAFGFASMAIAQTSSSGGAPLSSNCRIMTLKSGESLPSGSLATPSAGLPTATAGRRGAPPTLSPTGSPTTSSLPDGSKMVTDSTGGCTIYRTEERQPNPSR
jgi:hypothetical protein